MVYDFIDLFILYTACTIYTIQKNQKKKRKHEHSH